MSRKTKPRLLISRLLAEGRLSNGEIGEVLGCSSKTIQRVARQMKEEMGDYEGKLQEYESIFQEIMPISERAERYVAIARQTDDPKTLQAALKALERMDDLQGIVTERDKMRVKLVNTEPPAQAPMFMLPAGSRIAVTRAEMQMPTPTTRQQEVKMIEGVVDGQERNET